MNKAVLNGHRIHQHSRTQGRRNVGRAEKKLRAMETYEEQKIVTNYQVRN